MKHCHVAVKSTSHEYDIKVGRGLLGRVGAESRRCLGKQARRVAVVSNHPVFNLYGHAVIQGLVSNSFAVSHWLMRDGESHKSMSNLKRALDSFSESGLERNDAVVALGGGVVGDLAGFAAAVYLRGITLIQVPTTLLAQIDSSVGGKTAVNLPSGKNLVGALHQPHAVFIDTETLSTLPRRELNAGWCEAVKNGAVGGRDLFQQTVRFLEALKSNAKAYRSRKLEELIALHCAFKGSIVARDEREALHRTDQFSRRILNFGHTVGHALEAVTRYRRFKHGEAVGHGMLVAGEISKSLGLLALSELELLRASVELCGPLPSTRDLSEQAIIDAVGHDKKSFAGQVQWVLLAGIGEPRIVDGREIKPRLLRDSLRAVLHTGG